MSTPAEQNGFNLTTLKEPEVSSASTDIKVLENQAPATHMVQRDTHVFLDPKKNAYTPGTHVYVAPGTKVMRLSDKKMCTVDASMLLIVEMGTKIYSSSHKCVVNTDKGNIAMVLDQNSIHASLLPTLPKYAELLPVEPKNDNDGCLFSRCLTWCFSSCDRSDTLRVQETTVTVKTTYHSVKI